MNVFPDGAPDVAIGGLDIARATLVQRYGDDDDHGANGLHWDINLSAGHSERAVLLLGDLLVHDERWFGGVTSIVVVTFRDPSRILPIGEGDHAEVEARLGAWAAHVLYDTAAAGLRRLIAGTEVCKLSVPRETPNQTPERCAP